MQAVAVVSGNPFPMIRQVGRNRDLMPVGFLCAIAATASPVNMFSPSSCVTQVAAWEVAGAGITMAWHVQPGGKDWGTLQQTFLLQKRQKIWTQVQSLCLSDPVLGTESQERQTGRQVPIFTISSLQRLRFQARDLYKLTKSTCQR